MIFKKTMSQYLTKDYCQGWNDAIDAVYKDKDRWMVAKCISIRKTIQNQITINDTYLIDRLSINTLHNEVYCEVYTMDKRYVGFMRLLHFETVFK